MTRHEVLYRLCIRVQAGLKMRVRALGSLAVSEHKKSEKKRQKNGRVFCKIASEKYKSHVRKSYFHALQQPSLCSVYLGA